MKAGPNLRPLLAKKVLAERFGKDVSIWTAGPAFPS